MDGLPLGLAVAAGMVAVVNPCGFALLPAYASLLVVGDDAPSRGGSVDDPVISEGQDIQRWLADGLDRLGVEGTVAVVVVLLAAAIGIPRLIRRREKVSP